MRMEIVSYLFGFILIFNIALGFSIIFLEHKDASSAWAWLMVLLFIPILGFFLYLIFGKPISNRKIFTWDTKSKLGVKAAVQSQLRDLDENRFQFKDERLAEYKDLYYLHLRNNDAILTTDNQVEIFTDGHDKFNALIQDLEKAKDHIHLLYYIIRNDELGQKIANILIKKANEGVEVRLLFDDLGSRRLKNKYIKRIRDAGAQVESFFPPKFFKLNLKINYRNHRKLAIIDGKVGYIGGFNIGDEYLGKHKKFGYWRDTHLKICGDAVKNMQTRFILDWNQASRKDILYDERYYAAKPKGDPGIPIVSSGPDSEWEQIKNGYIEMIMSAKERIYIWTPYFIPDESMRDALSIAALSGVEVNIMIPNKPDHPFVYWATLSHTGDMLNAGAKVYIYQKGFMHSKTLIIDDKIATVGTANIDVRSFRLNFEVNAFLYDFGLAKRLVDAFHEDVNHSTQMTKKLYNKR